MKERHPETPGSLPYVRPDIIETTDSDYRFRIILPDSDVALILLDEAMRIRYTNFKNRVAEVLGHDRAGDLHDVWSTMFRVQLREHGRRSFEFEDEEEET